MRNRSRYLAAKEKLLTDAEICSDNRTLFSEFFRLQEYKLKRINGLADLDDPTYKTLLDYTSRLRTVNRWFENKAWIALTKEDIRRVYDAVEDGVIRTQRGHSFSGRSTYYRKILLSKPFEMAGKKALVKEVMEFQTRTPHEEVRFIREPTFRSIIAEVANVNHRTLLWLSFDVGENITSLLQLRKRDFTRVHNSYSNAAEFHINLRREILKRGRTPRTEVTNYSETVELLDSLLTSRREDDLLFNFGYAAALKVLKRAVQKTGAVCIPDGQPVRYKDLRSSMACDLLGKGYTTDEVNQRLGHKPSSREIDRYVNFLALGRDRPKRRLHDNHVSQLQQEIQEFRDRENMTQRRLRSVQDEMAGLKLQLEANNRLMYEQVAKLVAKARETGKLTG